MGAPVGCDPEESRKCFFLTSLLNDCVSVELRARGEESKLKKVIFLTEMWSLVMLSPSGMSTWC